MARNNFFSYVPLLFSPRPLWPGCQYFRPVTCIPDYCFPDAKIEPCQFRPVAQLHIYAYDLSMRRKAGQLIPIEKSILSAAVSLHGEGIEEFHGFRIAKEINAREGTRLLPGHGTLYRALARLEQQGLLQSVWEDPLIAAEENRPRRRLYRLTGAPIPGLESLSVPSQGSQFSWGTAP